MDDATLPATRGPAYAQVEIDPSGGGGMLSPKSLGDVVAFATVMARADIALPKHLRGKDGACMAVTMQAMRWEMDPFAVANKSYSVNDRLAYEAQLIGAVVLTRAPIAKRPHYTYTGLGPTRRCKVEVTMKDGDVLEYETPEFKDIPTKNSPLWKGDPDQQLGYYAIRSWARRHTPEVILGVYTQEEAEQFEDAREVRAGTGMRDRLEARQQADGQQGFDAGHVVEELGPKPSDAGAPHDADFEDVKPEDPDAPAGDLPTGDEATGRSGGEGAVADAGPPETPPPPQEDATAGMTRGSDIQGPAYIYEDVAEFTSVAGDHLDAVSSPDDLTTLWAQWQPDLHRLRKADLREFDRICALKNRRKNELEAEAKRAEARG